MCPQNSQLYGHELHLPTSRFAQHLPEQFQRSRLVRHTPKAVQQMTLLG